MQTLYLFNKPVLILQLREKAPEELESYKFIYIERPQKALMDNLLDTLKHDPKPGFCISTWQPQTMFQKILEYFQHWQAAGGLVTNSEGDILIMFRRGKWDLPKGKVDPGEVPEETALREITEETGLKHLEIVEKLTETWHSYPVSVYKDYQKSDKKDVLKQIHWYRVEFTGKELTVPQVEEDIMDILWIKPENIGQYLKYSYPNIKEVFKAAGYKISL